MCATAVDSKRVSLTWLPGNTINKFKYRCVLLPRLKSGVLFEIRYFQIFLHVRLFAANFKPFLLSTVPDQRRKMYSYQNSGNGNDNVLLIFSPILVLDHIPMWQLCFGFLLEARFVIFVYVSNSSIDIFPLSSFYFHSCGIVICSCLPFVFRYQSAWWTGCFRRPLLDFNIFEFKSGPISGHTISAAFSIPVHPFTLDCGTLYCDVN